MKIQGIIDDIFTKLDIFKFEPYLTIKNKVKISSRLSQLCSVLFFIYLFYNLHNQFESRLNLSSQQVSNSEVYIGSNATIRIEDNFMMAFKIDHDWIMKNLNNLFEFNLVHYNQEVITKESKTRREVLQFCTKEHFRSLDEI